MKAFDELYSLYGQDVKLNPVSIKDNKQVYELSSLRVKAFVIVCDVHSITTFYKYMQSLWVQQQLFLDGANVSEIMHVYTSGKKIVSVHRKVETHEIFSYSSDMLHKLGVTIAKIHKASIDPKYRKRKPFLRHPKWYARVLMYLRNTAAWVYYHTIYSYMNSFPCGICHRDMNKTNPLLGLDDKIYLLDFDKHRFMPFAIEIVYFYRKKLNDEKLLRLFVKGYCSERPLMKKEIKYIEKELGFKIFEN